MKIKFYDGTVYEINDGASLGRIEVPVSDSVSIEVIVASLNAVGNLKKVQFVNDAEEVTGEYLDMKLSAACSIETIDEVTTVVFGLVEKTDVEKRLDVLENGQEIQDGAISELAEVISEAAEGGGK